MLRKCLILFFLLFKIIHSECLLDQHITNNIDGKEFVIGARGYGFFSEFFHVIQNLLWCEQNKKKAFIYWDDKCLYYEPNGFNGLYNAWEYYFEPVSDLIYNSKYKIRRDYETPNGFEIPYQNIALNELEELRPIFYSVIQTYVKIKPYILKDVEEFYSKHMSGSIIIGMHLRGTDKYKEVVHIIKPIDLINKAKEYAELVKNNFKGKQIKFLVASDEQKLIDFVKANIKENVIVYEGAIRSLDGKAIHGSDKHNKDGDFFKLGYDVLVETLLLSRCDFFVHTQSNVSTAVLFLNPEIIHFTFDGFAML